MAKLIDSLMISIGIDPERAKAGFNQISQAAAQTDGEFTSLAGRWKGLIGGLASSFLGPVAGAMTLGKMISSYFGDVSEVATQIGAYNQKVEEWRLKRAQLARVTKEDIELYKKQREALTTFKIALGDLSAKVMRTFMPVMKLGVDLLNDFSKWISANEDNIVRFLLVTAGVLTAVFLPAILKTSAAMLASPLTWIIGALGLLVVVVDDLVTYMQGGKSALSGFWSYFGTGPEIMAKLNSAFKVFKEIVSVLWKPLAAMAAAFAAFKIGAVLVKGVTTAFAGLKAAMTALAAHPLIAVLFVVIGLITWIADAWKRAGGEWSNVLTLMKSDLKGFLNLFGGLGDTLAEIFAPFEAMFDNGIKTVANFFGVIFNSVKLIFAYLTGASDEAKDKIAGALWDCLGGLFSGIVTGIGELASLLAKGFAGLLSLIGAGLAAIPGLIAGAFGLLIDGLSAVVSFVGNALAQLFAYIAGLAADGAAILIAPFVAFGELISGAIDSVSQGFSDLWSGIVSGVSSAMAVTVESVSAAFDWIGGVWSGAAQLFEDITGSIELRWMYLTGAISDAIDDTVAFIKRVFESIGGTISRTVDGAAALIGDIVSAVSGFIKDITGFISSGLSSLASSFDETLSAVSGFFSACFGGLADMVSGVFSTISDLISGAFDSGLQAAQGFFDAVLGFFTQIPEMISKAFDIGGLIEGATSKLKEGLGGAWDKVSGFFGGGGDNEAQNKIAAITENQQAVIEAAPVAAQTSNIVNNENNNRTNNNTSAKSNVNNITINTNSDRPQAIARALTGVLPEDEDPDYGYVSAADNGNYNY